MDASPFNNNSSMKIRKLVDHQTGGGGADVHDPTMRLWSDLPMELLEMIATRLNIIQLVAFRGVCKSWRIASSTASANFESVAKTRPSLLVYNDQDKKCTFYYKEEGAIDGGRKVYEMSIPEFENATCLASNHGWLLLYQQGSGLGSGSESSGSLFFLCPFSRARIDLPESPESDLSGYVGAFSGPPTSPECIVSVAKRLDNSDVKLYLIRRGHITWTKHEANIEVGSLKAAVYVEQKSSFYLLDDNRKLLKFSLKRESWKRYTIAKNLSGSSEWKPMPFRYREQFSRSCGIKTWMGLEDGEDVSISICGAPLPGQEGLVHVCNENIEAPGKQMLKGIWIQARFHQILENQTWAI